MTFWTRKRIFLDHAGGRENPSGIHEEGYKAKKKLEEARAKVARVLQVQARDVVFTSGGTESDNLALIGVYEAAKANGIERPHVIVSHLEHPAVLESAKEIKRRGGEVTIIEAVGGVIKTEEVMKEVKENTVLVSMMYVNNETGALQPVSKVGRSLADLRKKSQKKYPYLHTDASQAAHVFSLNMTTVGADLMTLEGSKVNGPRGVGALILRSHVTIQPILFGGGQERGLRAGTENVEAIRGFADALEASQRQRGEEYKRLELLKEEFIRGIKDIPGIVINTPTESAPHIVSISFPGELHEFLAIKLDREGIAVSTGSSCDSTKSEDEKEALRFSFGKDTRKNDVQYAVKMLRKVMAK